MQCENVVQYGGPTCSIHQPAHQLVIRTVIRCVCGCLRRKVEQYEGTLLHYACGADSEKLAAFHVMANVSRVFILGTYVGKMEPMKAATE